MPVTKWILCGLLALAAGSLLAAPPSLAQKLRASRWRHRLLLIGAPTSTQAEFQHQKALLAAATNGLTERDFKVIEVVYDQLTPADRQYWTQQLGQPLAGFRAVLIGKDGGAKRTETQPLAPADLFSTVDKMPMRRQEMHRAN